MKDHTADFAHPHLAAQQLADSEPARIVGYTIFTTDDANKFLDLTECEGMWGDESGLWTAARYYAKDFSETEASWVNRPPLVCCRYRLDGTSEECPEALAWAIYEVMVKDFCANDFPTWTDPQGLLASGLAESRNRDPFTVKENGTR